mmetsp:Transcript_9378/g.18301  ORF Transcript_9378/g.18301 Transcript_9378/m.18301 type:complete len:106 (+) Transcript_9378:22-339(+)
MKNYYLKIFSDIENDQNNNNNNNKQIYIKKQNFKTFHNFLTKFEKTRIIGIRALQISHGSMVYVQLEGETDSIQVFITKIRLPLKSLEKKKFLLKLEDFIQMEGL